MMSYIDPLLNTGRAVLDVPRAVHWSIKPAPAPRLPLARNCPRNRALQRLHRHMRRRLVGSSRMGRVSGGEGS